MSRSRVHHRPRPWRVIRRNDGKLVGTYSTEMNARKTADSYWTDCLVEHRGTEEPIDNWSNGWPYNPETYHGERQVGTEEPTDNIPTHWPFAEKPAPVVGTEEPRSADDE